MEILLISITKPHKVFIITSIETQGIYDICPVDEHRGMHTLEVEGEEIEK